MLNLILYPSLMVASTCLIRRDFQLVDFVHEYLIVLSPYIILLKLPALCLACNEGFVLQANECFKYDPQSPARFKYVIFVWKLMIAGAVERAMSSKIRPIPHLNPLYSLQLFWVWNTTKFNYCTYNMFWLTMEPVY